MPRQVTEAVAEALPGNVEASGQVYRLVPGSVYDGDTLRVTDGAQEIKIRLCGIDAPEKEQPMGVESWDHLRFGFSSGKILTVKSCLKFTKNKTSTFLAFC